MSLPCRTGSLTQLDLAVADVYPWGRLDYNSNSKSSARSHKRSVQYLQTLERRKLETQKPTPNPEIPKKHRVYANFFRKVRANLCLLPNDAKSGNQRKLFRKKKLVQMNFFILGGFHRVDFRSVRSTVTKFHGNVRGEVRVNVLALFASKPHIFVCGSFTFLRIVRANVRLNMDKFPVDPNLAN